MESPREKLQRRAIVILVITCMSMLYSNWRLMQHVDRVHVTCQQALKH